MKSPVLIIGAGPYGVSIALELHRRGVPFVVHGEPFSLWHRHTLSAASLRSDVHVSEVFTKDRRHRLDSFMDATLPPADARRVRQGRVPVSLFRDYLRQVQSRLPFPIVEQRITGLCGDGNGFVATTAGGETIAASQVVLACGVEGHRYLPPCLADLDSERVVHGWHVQQYESARGQRILIVGSGQSAAEAVWHLRPHNQITWLHRTRPTYFADPIALPRPIFALAMRGSHVFSLLPGWLRSRLRKNLVGATITPDLEPHVAADDVEQIQGDIESLRLVGRGGAVHSAALNRDFDLVVACTGYRYGLRNLTMLAPRLAEQIRCEEDMPVLDRRFQTSVPGLYVVGAMAEPKHGPAMRFMSGTRTAAMLVGAAVAGRFTQSSR